MSHTNQSHDSQSSRPIPQEGDPFLLFAQQELSDARLAAEPATDDLSQLPEPIGEPIADPHMPRPTMSVHDAERDFLYSMGYGAGDIGNGRHRGNS